MWRQLTCCGLKCAVFKRKFHHFEDGVHETSNKCEDDDTLEPYADELIADEEWLKRYHKEQEEKRRLERFNETFGE